MASFNYDDSDSEGHYENVTPPRWHRQYPTYRPSPYANFEIPINPENLPHVRFEPVPRVIVNDAPISLHENYFHQANQSPGRASVYENVELGNSEDDLEKPIPLYDHNYAEVDFNQLKRLTGGKVRRIQSHRKSNKRRSVIRRSYASVDGQVYDSKASIYEDISPAFEDAIDACIKAEISAEPQYENAGFLHRRNRREFWGKDFQNLDM